MPFDSAGIYKDESGMMQYYVDDSYACDVCSKEEEWYLTKRNIFNGASTTFVMPCLHLFTNLNIFCISVKEKKN